MWLLLLLLCNFLPVGALTNLNLAAQSFSQGALGTEGPNDVVRNDPALQEEFKASASLLSHEFQDDLGLVPLNVDSFSVTFATNGSSAPPFAGPFGPLSPANPYVKGPYETLPNSSAHQAFEPFVRVKVDVFHNSTSFKVDIATPNAIISVYLVIFMPLGFAWVAMYHYGTEERHYPIVLAVSLCSTIIGMDLVNQSLSALTEAPTAVAAIQALAMALITGFWSLFSEVKQEALAFKPLLKWLPVAALFALYQLVNHVVSYLCSLSERTVFLNLCPALALFFELTLLPRRIAPSVSFSQKMALSAMVTGALVFALQDPDFTVTGVASALVLTVCVLPYRVCQRWLLMECLELPVPLLAFYDAIALLVPAVAITARNQAGGFWESWQAWFKSPSIVLMMALSWLTFAGQHVCTLLLLRVGSATSYLVLHNLAGFIVVFEGILFFHDRVVQSPLVFAGICISLISGLWYALETQLRGAAAGAAATATSCEG